VTSPVFQNPATLSLSASALVAPADVRSPSAEEFAAACSAHLDQVWRQLRAMGVVERYLDDATQEVFLVAQRKLGSFDGRAKISTWLYAIAYRIGCNYRRRAQREPKAELVADEHQSRESRAVARGKAIEGGDPPLLRRAVGEAARRLRAVSARRSASERGRRFARSQ
jgi:DNA-directed RNA polymerase specialized sigma24 family protein